MPNMFGGDQFDSDYAPHLYKDDVITMVINELETLPDLQLRSVCKLLVDIIFVQPYQQSRMWTLSQLIVAIDARDLGILIHCTCWMVIRNILEMHFLYKETPISDYVIAKAYADGFLTDPVDGSKIYEFETTIYPYFQIHKHLLKECK